MFKRNQWMWVFISLAALRLVIGFHFFTEGKSKIDSGSWDASGFFRNAVGPLRPFYLQALPDYEGNKTLCLVRNGQAEEKEPASGDVKTPEFIQVIEGSDFHLDTRPTMVQWGRHLQKTLVHYKLSKAGMAAKKQDAKRRLKQLEQEVQNLQKSGDPSALAATRKSAQELKVFVQRLEYADPYSDAFLILGRRAEQLHDYLKANREEIENYAIGLDRLDGFAIDGQGGKKAGSQVESLRSQIASIKSDRWKLRMKHVGEIEGIWKGLEAELNAYGQSMAVPGTGVSAEANLALPKLDPPSTIQKSSQIYWINMIVPYFDLIIGICLLLGFLTRYAAVLGAVFLFGILLTQLPWVPGAANTFPQWIECLGLLVLAATGAGRFGGIDGLFAWIFSSKESSEPQTQS